jgi:hypothetical protein
MLNLSFQVHSINELTGAMLAVELAAGNNWSKLWFESISKRLLWPSAISLWFLGSWKLMNRWLNCINLTKFMSSIASISLENAINIFKILLGWTIFTGILV